MVAELAKRVSYAMAAQARPSATFLGTTPQGWGGFMLKSSIAIAVAIFAWYNFVNDAIEERPTFGQVEDIAEGSTIDHDSTGHAHPAVLKILEGHEAQINALSDVQIRQTTIMELQTDTLREIREGLRD